MESLPPADDERQVSRRAVLERATHTPHRAEDREGGFERDHGAPRIAWWGSSVRGSGEEEE